MRKLEQFKLHWIEEPTSADDVLGHKAISEAVRSGGVGVATGEACQNRVMFKQFLMSGGMQFCQVRYVQFGSGENPTIHRLIVSLVQRVCLRFLM